MNRYMQNFLLILLLIINHNAIATMPRLDFTLHKIESGLAGPTVLVIGGIQGDEPGGFNAAALLTTDYKIKSGNLWVVPNLNFESIIKRSRGVYGDMNRKFLHINESDPEYTAIQKIKSILREEQVDLILNLHDGSGFYRKEYIDRLHNPDRWGQSIIIDQAALDSGNYGNLNNIANKLRDAVNRKLTEVDHYYEVKNTRTREGDKEMEKTLTYFAIQNNKPAFGLEVSKQFSTHERVYYHLVVVEEFLAHLGIEFERGFQLNKRSVKKAIDDDIKLSLYDSKIILDIAKARSKLSYVPMKKDSPVDFVANSPLIAIVNDNDKYKISYGNRELTRLFPEYLEYDFSL
ncbi:MAG: succinylglutamate desuccinylase/aspartoacylase family protein, partial [Gammaproteobacteria bacterium]|nr:succinylglutamate desuccinylase/aspartoacylase family protein [Gammaproteobacteria bacterium]